MPYQKGGKGTWYTRVVTVPGERVLCSCRTTDESTARTIERWHQDVRKRLDPLGVLELITAGRVELADAWRLGEQGTVAKVREEDADAADVDLAPWLEEWERTRAGQRTGGGETLAAYLKQIRVLFPARPWRRSTLTTTGVARALDALTCSNATRNRYRSALSAFCSFLVRRGVLEVNPARVVGGYSEGEPPVHFWEHDEPQRLVAAIPAPYQGREAMMAGSGADWTDTTRMRVRDIDLKTREVRCHGSKTRHRNRVIRITQPWVLPYLRRALKGKLPDALAFPGGHRYALRKHYEACEAAKVPLHGLHCWRHTYAVAELRAGETPSVVAHQLGHGTPALVWRRYGRFVPNQRDYREDREARALAEAQAAAGKAKKSAASKRPTRPALTVSGSGATDSATNTVRRFRHAV